MRLTPLLAAILTALLTCSALAQTSQPSFPTTTVFRAGQDGYPVYRIPAAILAPDNKTLLCFAEARAKASDTGEIHLVLKRSTDGGKTFSPLQVVWSDPPNTCGNPCPVVDATTGTIHLLMTHNRGDDHERDIIAGKSKGTRTVWHTASTDHGATWSAPREITKDVKKPEWTWYATGPGVGIQLTQGPHKGRLLIPANRVAPPRVGNSHVIYSDDHGQTWQLGGSPPLEEFNESQLAELPDGRLILNMRNYPPPAPTTKSGVVASATTTPSSPSSDFRHRGVALSADAGLTFPEVSRHPDLPEPVCQASLLRFGDLLLFANPASTTTRHNLTLRASRDAGQSWPVTLPIYPGPSAYSSLTPLPDGAIGLLYEAGDKKLYERIDLARIPATALAP